jgi:hypothetical protein
LENETHNKGMTCGACEYSGIIETESCTPGSDSKCTGCGYQCVIVCNHPEDMRGYYIAHSLYNGYHVVNYWCMSCIDPDTNESGYSGTMEVECEFVNGRCGCGYMDPNA